MSSRASDEECARADLEKTARFYDAAAGRYDAELEANAKDLVVRQAFLLPTTPRTTLDVDDAQASRSGNRELPVVRRDEGATTDGVSGGEMKEVEALRQESGRVPARQLGRFSEYVIDIQVNHYKPSSVQILAQLVGDRLALAWLSVCVRSAARTHSPMVWGRLVNLAAATPPSIQ